MIHTEHSSAHRVKWVNLDWPSRNIDPAVVGIMASSLATGALRRPLVSSPHIEEQVSVRTVTILSPRALIVQLGVFLVQEQEGVLKTFREISFILFLQSRKSRIHARILDSFNTNEIYEEKENEAPLKLFYHKVVYDFSLENSEQNPIDL